MTLLMKNINSQSNFTTMSEQTERTISTLFAGLLFSLIFYVIICGSAYISKLGLEVYTSLFLGIGIAFFAGNEKSQSKA